MVKMRIMEKNKIDMEINAYANMDEYYKYFYIT